MLQRRRKRVTDPAIAAIARELLAAGKPFLKYLRRNDEEEARLINARLAAESAGYAIGVSYADAITARRNALAAAAAAPEGADDAALGRAVKFRAVAEAAAVRLRLDARA